MPGQAYEVTFTVSAYVAGNVVAVVGDTEGTDRAANGTFTEVILAGAGVDVDIRADLDFDGSVDTVTVTRAEEQPEFNLPSYFREDLDASVPKSVPPMGKLWCAGLECPCGGERGFDLVYQGGYLYVHCRGCKKRVQAIAIASRKPARLDPGFFD